MRMNNADVTDRGKIVSPEGKLLGPGEVGELWTKSPSNALGCTAFSRIPLPTIIADAL